MSGSVGGPARQLGAPGPLFDKEIRGQAREGGMWGIVCSAASVAAVFSQQGRKCRMTQNVTFYFSAALVTALFVKTSTTVTRG